MSHIDFNSMTLDEAKSYFLGHRDDADAFHAYMDKLHTSGRAIVIDPTDSDSEAKAQAAIQQRLDDPHSPPPSVEEMRRLIGDDNPTNPYTPPTSRPREDE